LSPLLGSGCAPLSSPERKEVGATLDSLRNPPVTAFLREARARGVDDEYKTPAAER
jgi:hypothetical protein